MTIILMNSFREKIRSKSLYIVGVLSSIIILFLNLVGDFSINNKAVTSFDDLIQISIIMANFFSMILAIMMSLQTIPNEFERKTTHLVLVRGIKKYEYLLSLTFSNVLVSLLGLFIIYMSTVLFATINGRADMILRLFLAMGVLSINIILISVIVSFFSMAFPLFLNGILGMIIFLIGSFHNMIYIFSQNLGGAFARIIKIILFIFPNFYSLQSQAGKILSMQIVDFKAILVQMFYIYIVIGLIMLFSSRIEV